MIRILTLIPLLLAAPAMAQSVGDCTDIATARNLQEPWEQTTASYANGDVRIAVIDTMEPAAAAVHLMVLSPPRNEIGDRQCKMVSLQSDGGAPFGFFNIDFKDRTADYDPARGLVVKMPVYGYNPETGGGDPGELTLIINQSTGEITADVAGS